VSSGGPTSRTPLLQRAGAALGGFLRGFLGLARIGRDADSARRALERRAGTRRGCC
jgi:hypothetical protein